jgi:pilus assembly protein CpaB
MIAAAGVVLAVMHTLRPPPPPTVHVVRALTSVPAGTALQEGQVALQAVAASAVPQDAVTTVDVALGQTVIAGLTPGQILTTPLLLTPRAVSRPGRVLTPLRLQDAGVVGLLRAGEVVDVLATDPDTAETAVVATGVRVVVAPSSSEERLPTSTEDVLLLIEVDRPAATRLAAAAVKHRFSLLLP